MEKLIPSFKSSIFDEAQNITVDIAEIGVDSILQDGFLKDLPIVGLLVGVAKIGQNVYDRNLLKQTIQFIKEFNAGIVDHKKLENYKKLIELNNKKAEEELGRVLIILNSNIEIEKAKMVANLYRSYINEEITWLEFCEISEIIRMLFLNDFDYISKIYNNIISNTEGCELYPFNRLESLGLITTTMKTKFSYGSNDIGETKFITITKLGKKFYESVIKLE